MAGSDDGGARDGWGRRLGWFVLLWLCGVAAVGAVAYAIRAVLL